MAEPQPRKRALVVCPGRGVYNKSELGYLARWHHSRAAVIAQFDAYRIERGQPAISTLDDAQCFDPALHLPGDNAAALIYACAYADWLAIDRRRFDIIAVTGNSMGWYSTLAVGGAMNAMSGLALANQMGVLMHDAATGGQVVHSTVDADWTPIPGRRDILLSIEPTLAVSIELGGMIVLAGSQDAVDRFVSKAPRDGVFPMPLSFHAAFHTPLLEPVSARARQEITSAAFAMPATPMIDGRGHIWRPHMSDVHALWDYTLGAQVTRTFDFTRAITVGIREFAPDCLIVLGPGETLGGAVIQSLIAANWHGMASRADFNAMQADNPVLFSMSRSDQRPHITGS